MPHLAESDGGAALRAPLAGDRPIAGGAAASAAAKSPGGDAGNESTAAARRRDGAMSGNGGGQAPRLRRAASPSAPSISAIAASVHSPVVGTGTLTCCTTGQAV